MTINASLSVVVPVPAFPSVPMLPGVPNLLRAPGSFGAPLPSSINGLQTQGMPAALSSAAATPPIWGVFDATGAAALLPDSIMAFGLRSEFRVSDYPVQDGQFASYDKVTVPREIMVRMVKGLGLQDRVAFELACETVAASLDTYTVITPERSYTNMNAFRHEVNRVASKGASYIEAEMYFRQINQTDAQYSTPTQAASNTANATQPASIPPASVGVVQPANPSAQIEAAITAVLGPSPESML